MRRVPAAGPAQTPVAPGKRGLQMDVRPRHWGVALFAAVALHSSVLIAALAPSNPGTPAAGTGGIEVSLGPAGAAQGSATAVTEAESVAPLRMPAAEAVAAVPEELSPRPVEAVAETQPVAPQPAAEPVETLEAVESPELIPAVPPPPAAVELPAEQDVALVEPLPDVPPEKPRPPVQPAAAPLPATPQPATPQALPDPAPAAPEPRGIQAAALAGDAGPGGSTKLDAAGIGNATPGGGQPGDPGYNALLSAWLQQHHEFPARAQRRKMYGETKVRFTIDRSGNLLESEVVDSSGYELLDEAALATLRRASPLPPMPAEMSGSEYNPIITLRFTPPT